MSDFMNFALKKKFRKLANTEDEEVSEKPKKLKEASAPSEVLVPPPVNFDPICLVSLVWWMREMWSRPGWNYAECLRLSRSCGEYAKKGPLIGPAYKLVRYDGVIGVFSGAEVRAGMTVALDRMAIIQGYVGGLRSPVPSYAELRFVKEILRLRHVSNVILPKLAWNS